jgi:hypothetical protein
MVSLCCVRYGLEQLHVISTHPHFHRVHCIVHTHSSLLHFCCYLEPLVITRVEIVWEVEANCPRTWFQTKRQVVSNLTYKVQGMNQTLRLLTSYALTPQACKNITWSVNSSITTYVSLASLRTRTPSPAHHATRYASESPRHDDTRSGSYAK